MADEDRPQADRQRPWYLRLGTMATACVLLLLLWAATPFLARAFAARFFDVAASDPDMLETATRSSEAVGQFGDLFGSITSLFTGLALVGVFFTLLIQRDELRTAEESAKKLREVIEDLGSAAAKSVEAIDAIEEQSRAADTRRREDAKAYVDFLREQSAQMERRTQEYRERAAREDEARAKILDGQRLAMENLSGVFESYQSGITEVAGKLGASFSAQARRSQIDEFRECLNTYTEQVDGLAFGGRTGRAAIQRLHAALIEHVKIHSDRVAPPLRSGEVKNRDEIRRRARLEAVTSAVDDFLFGDADQADATRRFLRLGRVVREATTTLRRQLDAPGSAPERARTIGEAADFLEDLASTGDKTSELGLQAARARELRHTLQSLRTDLRRDADAVQSPFRHYADMVSAAVSDDEVAIAMYYLWTRDPVDMTSIRFVRDDLRLSTRAQHGQLRLADPNDRFLLGFDA